MLLVPGKVTDPKNENWEQVWERSQAGVNACLDDAEAAGVVIAIETVWNDFITKPEHLIRYVDEFDNPHVGAYFDCSNMLQVRRLERRLDSQARPTHGEVRLQRLQRSRPALRFRSAKGTRTGRRCSTALVDVGYTGWATSEVTGGGEAELTDIYRRMARVLGKSAGRRRETETSSRETSYEPNRVRPSGRSYRRLRNPRLSTAP